MTKTAVIWGRGFGPRLWGGGGGGLRPGTGGEGGMEVGGGRLLHTCSWLYLFNAELSSKRYWRGPRSQDVEEERDYT